MLAHHGPYDYTQNGRQASLENLEEKYKERILAEVKRNDVRAGKYAGEIRSVLDRLPYSTESSMAMARIRAYEAAGLDAEIEELAYHSRGIKKTDLTTEAQNIKDQKDSVAYEMRVAKRFAQGRVKAGPVAPGNHFEEKIDEKALNDRSVSDDARLRRHFHQHQVALQAEEHRHSAIEDRMVLQEMKMLQNTHNNDLRTARMDGTLSCAQGKIDLRFQNAVDEATEHHKARLLEFEKLEQKHARVLANVDTVEKNCVDVTKSYLARFNEEKKTEMRDVFEEFAINIGTTLSTDALPIKKKKEKKAHATDPAVAAVVVVEAVAPAAKASKKKKKGQAAAPLAEDIKLEKLTKSLARVLQDHMKKP
jgi:hypothetical protein